MIKRILGILLVATLILGCEDTSSEEDVTAAIAAVGMSGVTSVQPDTGDNSTGKDDTDTDTDTGSGDTSTPPAHRYRIFVTSGQWSGNFGGLSGADDKCNTDANKPASGTYKALFVDNNVLKNSTVYYRTDQTTKIGTTDDSGDMVTPLDNSVSDVYMLAWTGANTSAQYSSNCNGWTCGVGRFGVNGGLGRTDRTNANWLGYTGISCSLYGHLYCVEQ